MEILDVIKSRRTIHSFTDANVSDEILKLAIEAASLAPNHHLTWPWFFIRPMGPAREKLADLHVHLKMKKASEKGSEPMSSVAQTAARRKFLEAPVTLFVGIRKSDSSMQMKEDYASLACAVQNMFLFLWSRKIGSKWSTGGVTRADEAYKILGISPLTHEIGGVIFIGHPKTIPPTPERPPIDQFFWQVRV